MAIQFSENFYPYGVVGSSLASANSVFNTQWILSGSIQAIISSGFRANAKALTLSRSTGGFSQAERRFTSTADSMIVGYAFRSTTRGAITFQIKDGATTLVALEWPNQFQINGVTGAATILLNKVYYVEIKLTKSTKEVVLKVNGYDYLTTTITDTIPDTLQCIWGFPSAGVAANFIFSDVVFVDSSPGKYTDFINPQRITNRLVDSVVNPGWKPEPSDKTRLQIMQNMPPVTGEYTESDTVGEKDFYKSSTVVDDTTTITAVAVTSLVAKTDIDDQYVALAVSDGVTDKNGTDLEVPIQPAFIQHVFETGISDTNWTKASVEAAAFGPVVRPRPAP